MIDAATHADSMIRASGVELALSLARLNVQLRPRERAGFWRDVAAEIEKRREKETAS
jgi:hypothetical protein